MAIELLSPEVLMGAAPVVLGFAGWVGVLHQRVNGNEKDNASFTEGFAKHMADDALAHQRIANIEGKLELVVSSLERIERRLDEQRQ
jgi:hypothetical protein